MIDPHIQGLLQAMAESGFALPDPITPSSLRATLDNPIPGPPVEIAKQVDISITAEKRSIGGRLYHPAPGQVLPVVLFFHGGGWVHGTLDMFDRLCATLSSHANCTVVSVDYRLAPEHPFPSAWEDAAASLHWVKTNHDELGIDPRRIALAGDSAGGNLAAATAQLAIGDQSVIHQLLFYPALDGRCNSSSFNAEHVGFLSSEQMQWYWEQYAPGELREDARVSPSLSTDLSGLAPATIIVAGNDPLHDEGVAYARSLEQVGVEVALYDYPGAIHGFVSLLGLVPLADDAVEKAAKALQAAFT